MPLKLISFTPHEDKESELEALLRSLVNPTREETGCLRYDLFKTDAGYAILEEWDSVDHLDAHKATDHFKAFKEQSPALVAEKSSQTLSLLM